MYTTYLTVMGVIDPFALLIKPSLRSLKQDFRRFQILLFVIFFNDGHREYLFINIVVKYIIGFFNNKGGGLQSVRGPTGGRLQWVVIFELDL